MPSSESDRLLAAVRDLEERALERVLSRTEPLVLATGGAALWTTQQSRFYLARSGIAHNILETYLNLSANTFTLFKQFGDTLLIGKNATGNLAQETELLLSLETDLKRLRHLIEAEYEISENRPDEIADLQRLAIIENKIQKVIREYKEVKDLKDAGRRTNAWSKLAGVLEQSVDQNFRGLIGKAIEAERADALAADKDAVDTLERLSKITKMLLSLAAVFCLATLYFLRRRVEEPLSNLTAGTEALAKGDLSHRIAISGRDEFASLAGRFNGMAADLEASRGALVASKSELEQAMSERTAELNAVTAAFENADNVRRRFLADISHELRTPLTVIRGEAEVALRGTEMQVKEYRTTLERIVEQSAHTASLVDDLLFIARRDAGHARLNREPVAIMTLVEQICRDFAALGRNRNIKVELELKDPSAVVLGDLVRLRQLLIIVLDNAIRYSLPESSVRVSAGNGGAHVLIAVEDRGIGISKDDLPQVFERHYRGTHAARLYNSGTGLGLPMAKAIVEAHEGTIELKSEVQLGTTVLLSLPVASQNEIMA